MLAPCHSFVFFLNVFRTWRQRRDAGFWKTLWRCQQHLKGCWDSGQTIPIWLGDSSLPPHPGKGCSWLQDQVPLREVQESALQPARPLLLFVLFLIGIFFWDEEDQVLYPAACCKGDQSRQGVPGVPVSFLSTSSFPCHLLGHQQWVLDIHNCHQSKLFTQEQTWVGDPNPRAGLDQPIPWMS